MSAWVRIFIGIACLTVGIGLCVVSFTVRNEVISWYSCSGLLLHIVGGVLLRRGLRQRAIPVSTEISGAQARFLLMLLRRSLASLNAETLEAAARSAWEHRFGRNNDGSDYVEFVENGFGFVVQAHGNAFMVLDTEKGVRELTPPVRVYPESAIDIWSDYSHVLSVGVAYNCDADASRLCAFVGSLAVVLADGETLGLLHPMSGQLWRLDQETAERLNAQPEAFFGSEQAN